MPPTRHHRHARIRDLLAAGNVRNQTELQEQLATEGFAVNQGTLSRDLRDIGVVKTSTGYALPDTNGSPLPPPPPALGNLDAALATWLIRATPAQNQIVLHTPPGGAQALGRALDLARLPEIVGTIAGDDTILVICPDAVRARKLTRFLQKR